MLSCRQAMALAGTAHGRALWGSESSWETFLEEGVKELELERQE